MIKLIVSKNDDFKIEDINIPEFRLTIKGLKEKYAKLFRDTVVNKVGEHLVFQLTYDYRSIKERIFNEYKNYSDANDIYYYIESLMEGEFDLVDQDKNLSKFTVTDKGLFRLVFAFKEKSFQYVLTKLDDYFHICQLAFDTPFSQILEWVKELRD